MKITLFLTLFLVADAFARMPVPTFLVCTRLSCASASCRLPAGKTHSLVSEKIELQDDGEMELGRAVSSKDIEIDGKYFKLFADGSYSRNTDGTAYAPNVTVRLISDANEIQEAYTQSAAASLAIPRGSIDCRLE